MTGRTQVAAVVDVTYGAHGVPDVFTVRVLGPAGRVARWRSRLPSRPWSVRRAGTAGRVRFVTGHGLAEAAALLGLLVRPSPNAPACSVPPNADPWTSISAA